MAVLPALAPQASQVLPGPADPRASALPTPTRAAPLLVSVPTVAHE